MPALGQSETFWGMVENARYRVESSRRRSAFRHGGRRQLPGVHEAVAGRQKGDRLLQHPTDQGAANGGLGCRSDALARATSRPRPQM